MGVQKNLEKATKPAIQLRLYRWQGRGTGSAMMLCKFSQRKRTIEMKELMFEGKICSVQATGFLVPVCLNGAYFLFKHHSFISIVFFLFEKICKKHHCRDQYPSCHRYNRSCIAGFCCFSRFFCTHRRIFLVSRWLATSCRLSCTIRIIRSRWLAWGNRIWITRITQISSLPLLV